jgi:hypothetical protein
MLNTTVLVHMDSVTCQLSIQSCVTGVHNLNLLLVPVALRGHHNAPPGASDESRLDRYIHRNWGW